MIKPMIILYIADQVRSRKFYETVLNKRPVLDVEGMTEFELGDQFLLGLMPEEGIAKILGNRTRSPKDGNGIPRCELYIPVSDPVLALKTAMAAGGVEISPAGIRSWGDIVSYCSDPDGHVLAFAKQKV